MTLAASPSAAAPASLPASPLALLESWFRAAAETAAGEADADADLLAAALGPAVAGAARTLVVGDAGPVAGMRRRGRLVTASPAGRPSVLVGNRRSADLPFRTGSFDVVVDRHAGWALPELARIVAPAGRLVVEQVATADLAGLRSLFDAHPGECPEAELRRAGRGAEQAGLWVAAARVCRSEARFDDVASLVRFLAGHPKVVPGFSPASHVGPLLDLQARLDAGAPLRFERVRWVLVAHRPA